MSRTNHAAAMTVLQNIAGNSTQGAATTRRCSHLGVEHANLTQICEAGQPRPRPPAQVAAWASLQMEKPQRQTGVRRCAIPEQRSSRAERSL